MSPDGEVADVWRDNAAWCAVSTLSSVVEGVSGGWMSIDCCWLWVCAGQAESVLTFFSGVVARVGTLEARCNVKVVEIFDAEQEHERNGNVSRISNREREEVS